MLLEGKNIPTVGSPKAYGYYCWKQVTEPLGLIQQDSYDSYDASRFKKLLHLQTPSSKQVLCVTNIYSFA